ncbi:hypothetical protein NDU88_004415 [Pleurodeles waltl]|uniref:Uncharacterized protein n=1 Tax=Pleurodeles waltl TaxID=8319 RepID=A0AAV7UGF9_PLEWA|nr:hypothetical protein NDU88_004415 [Pleurodeles waltl]
MLNVRFLVNVTEAEHHDASVSKETETLARSSREVLRTLRNTVDFGGTAHFVYKVRLCYNVSVESLTAILSNFGFFGFILV